MSGWSGAVTLCEMKKGDDRVKRFMHAAGYAAVLAIGLCVGRYYEAAHSAHGLFKLVADRDSAEILQRVETLSKLRLNRVNEAIELLEVPLDGMVLQTAYGADQRLVLA